jgi:hypothetical protein
MIKIQCTKKLIEKFDIKVKSNCICDNFYSWHSHIFSFNRKNCIIFMNNKTRYNFIIFGVTKKQSKNFGDIIREAFIKCLEAENIDNKKISRYSKEFDKIEYTKTSDRSLIGQMNDMINITKYRLQLYEFLENDELIKINIDNNRVPLPKSEFIFSIDGLKKLI